MMGALVMHAQVLNHQRDQHGNVVEWGPRPCFRADGGRLVDMQGTPVVDEVYMDSMGFGMGCCCLQVGLGQPRRNVPDAPSPDHVPG